MAGLGQDLKVYGETYFDNASLPQNTIKNSDAILTTQKGVAGSFEVKVIVGTQIGLADTKVFSVKLQDSADGETYADVVTLYTKTADGAETIPAGTKLSEFVLPSTIRKWTRLVLTTDDAAATGSISAYPRYMPR